MGRGNTIAHLIAMTLLAQAEQGLSVDVGRDLEQLTSLSAPNSRIPGKYLGLGTEGQGCTDDTRPS